MTLAIPFCGRDSPEYGAHSPEDKWMTFGPVAGLELEYTIAAIKSSSATIKLTIIIGLLLVRAVFKVSTFPL
ncbi:hypothetical protein NBRC116595_39440 [Aliiglaciecola sp. NS0011-25]